MPDPSIQLPADLLHAATARDGRVALVVGAGCSLEAPTSLKLSWEYSRAAHEQLVADGVLAEGECPAPDDLSILASTVYAKYESQDHVVRKLPHARFRLAKANIGYLLVAALLREGVISCVATLNYDLALTEGLRRLDAHEVTEIAGPGGLENLGSSTIIYLHRNVNEQDAEKWILRKEALEDEWRDSWESVVAHRIAASPVVVFAGLGSPASVLTETLAKVRSAVPDVLKAFLADPAPTSAFADALDLPPENHVQLGWVAFMQLLSDRVAEQMRSDLLATCTTICEQNGFPDNRDHLVGVCAAFAKSGVLTMGAVRALWVHGGGAYEPDVPGSRGLVADLLMAVELLAEAVGSDCSFASDGAAQMHTAAGSTLRILGLSGQGTRRWASIEPLIAQQVGQLSHSPDLVLAGGFQGPLPDSLSPPEDIVNGDANDDITQGIPGPWVIPVDQLRANPAQYASMVAP